MRKECPYDVGDILQTKNATHPSTRWPGTTWKAITTMLLGASAAHPAGSTGGEETHTLTVDEMPRHGHAIATTYNSFPQKWGSWAFYSQAEQMGEEGGERNPWYTTNVGGSLAHNNMPPYTAVYIWERTS